MKTAPVLDTGRNTPNGSGLHQGGTDSSASGNIPTVRHPRLGGPRRLRRPNRLRSNSRGPIAHRGIWVEPSLLAEIEDRAKSAEGKVRHPVYKGLREDL
jgi:ATP dependent DNA ligase-like protein